MQIFLHLAPDRKPRQHLMTQFLQAGCSSWRKSNSVKALNAVPNGISKATSCILRVRTTRSCSFLNNALRNCFMLRVRSSHLKIHRTYPCTRRLRYMSVNVCPVCMHCELCIDLWYHASGVTSSCDHLKHVIVHCFYFTAPCTTNLCSILNQA